MANYYPKSLVRLDAEFRDPATGALVDPTVVVFTVQQEGTTTDSTYTYDSGDIPSATAVKDSVGLYHANYDTTSKTPGNYNYEAWGYGTYQTVNQGVFTIIPSKIA